MHFKTWPCCLAILLFITVSTTAEPLRLPAIFGDHMVLRQGDGASVWGWAEPGATVDVKLGGVTASTTTGDDGKWSLQLDGLKPSKQPTTLSATSGGQSVSFEDVLVGDVWLCSGQSNMAMGVGATRDAEQTIAGADHPNLRLFIVQRQVAFEPTDELQGQWVVCTPESILLEGGWKGFSAVGYFFGKALLESRETPIGLIGSYVGGSNLYAWTSEESLAAFPGQRTAAQARLRQFHNARETLPADQKEFDEVLWPAWQKHLSEARQQHAQDIAAWKAEVKKAAAAGTPKPKRPVMPDLPRRPQNPSANYGHAVVLFNGMIQPLAPFSLTGIIWYQGEANAYPGMAEEYAVALPRMITDWRERFSQPDLPFLFVQLPNLESKKDTWPIIRESQRTALATPHTGMAVTYDVGDPNDLHPAVKRPISERLVLLARHVAYGETLAWSGPMIGSATRDGDKVRLQFLNPGKALMAGAISDGHLAQPSDEPLRGFELSADGKAFLPADARVDGDAVVLDTDELAGQPVAVRYAWAPNPDANLYNAEGLPASPFRVEVE